MQALSFGGFEHERNTDVFFSFRGFLEVKTESKISFVTHGFFLVGPVGELELFDCSFSGKGEKKSLELY